MATPRKHWFRVADSIGRDPIPNDALATLLRLMCELNTRWARDGLTADEACTILLRPGDLCELTGCASLARARRIAHALTMHVSLKVDEYGVNTRITWAKWAEFQELRAPRLPRVSPGIARELPSPPPPPQDAEKKKKREEQEAASPPRALPTKSFESRVGNAFNLLANQRGEEADKRTWLRENLELIEAEAAKQGGNKSLAFVSLLMRYWHQHVSPRPMKGNGALALAPKSAAARANENTKAAARRLIEREIAQEAKT